MSNAQEPSNLLYFNGVNVSTGDYGLPPMSGEELSEFLQGAASPENLQELRFRHQQRDQKHFGVREGVDPKKLEESGWGILFAHDADPAIKEALSPLIELRREQAGDLFKLYEKADGHRPGETKAKFLARHGAGPGPADPKKVPYYLMIVGSPERIPYRFQTQLDVQYAVGRLHFDTIEAFGNYAASVVAAERGEVQLAQKAAFFGVQNQDDKATHLSTEHLVQPMLQHLEKQSGDWEIDRWLGQDASKANLARLLGGDSTPALLFTASHGVEFTMGDGRQIDHQGALLCQDWPGPKAWQGQGPIAQDFYFAGDDLTVDARLLGLICFSFACYGAGTPQHDEFAKLAFSDRRQEIAPRNFLGALPKKMLGHPGGGALAFIGHVERAWGYSFLWEGAGSQTAVFESTFDRLLDGHPVGSAFEYFDQRYAELSTVLSDQLEEADFGAEIDPYELAGMWTANNDARGYVVIGDPAVRLPTLEKDGDTPKRPRLELVSSPGSESTPTPTVEPTTQPADPAGRAPGTPGDDAGAAPDQAFGLFSGSNEPSSASSPGPLREFLNTMGNFLAKAIDNATELEVDTWTSHDMDHVEYKDGDYTGARLRASTRISIDGDTKLCIPRAEDGTIDQELWAIHTEAVRQAQASRAEMVRIAVEAGTGFLRRWTGN